ncbi:MAG: hypothetical protein COT09_02260 [Candidatus Hydromicrobium americanum]|nr:MAG: hypothetical protein COT09_02260 [Candidatus Hydromicrobium americanum]
MSDLIKSVVLASLGVLSLTREKAEKLAKDLIRKGELSETEEAKFVKDLMKKAEKAGGEIEEKIEKTVGKTLKKLNIPTRKDLDEIKEKLDKLSKK